MIKVLLYLNILNMIIGYYFSKYYDYRYREKLNFILPKEMDMKKKTKIYSNYKVLLKFCDLISMFLAIALGVIFYNLNIVEMDIVDKINSFTWKKVIFIIFGALWFLSLIYIGFIHQSRQEKKDLKFYNIDDTTVLIDRMIRTKGIPTIFFTFINILDILFYNYYTSEASLIYIAVILIFTLFLLFIQYIKKVDLLFKKQKFIKTVIMLGVIILITFIVDYLINIIII